MIGPRAEAIIDGGSKGTCWSVSPVGGALAVAADLRSGVLAVLKGR